MVLMRHLLNGLLLLEDLLLHKKHMVRVNYEYSDFMPVISGIPQDSITGPRLFGIYVNDLPEYISDNVECDLFADDVKCSIKHVGLQASTGCAQPMMPCDPCSPATMCAVSGNNNFGQWERK